MTMNMDNRNRVRKGVSTGGQFATEVRNEPSGISLKPELSGLSQEPAELEIMEAHNFPGADGSAKSYEIYRSSETEWTATARIEPVGLGQLLAPESPMRDGIDGIVATAMNRGDYAAFNDHFSERYGEDNVWFDHDHVEGSIYVGIDQRYDHAPSEHDAASDTRSRVDRQLEEMNPDDAQFYGRDLKDFMDRQAMMCVPIDLLRMNPPSGSAYDRAQISSSLMTQSRLGDQYVQHIAEAHADKHPELKKLAERGYADAAALQAIDDGGDINLRAVKHWASKAKPFSQRMEAEIAGW